MDHSVLETDRHRYVVVAPLAEGGMGAIYLGRRVGTEGKTDVVLKQLHPEHTNDPKLIEMFLREARLSASLDHKNIVRTLDLVNAGEDYFIVMEYVRGGDLRNLLRRAKRRQAKLSIDSLLFIVSEVLAALAYAHERRTANGAPLGLIHRDVSPSNILLGVDGTVKLTDFGIAKAQSQGSVVFKVKGKVGYMAPEQARGEPVDLRADLFAVGVVLYEILVGERLFLGNALTSAAVLFSQPVRPPSRKRPEIGSDLDEICMRALSLDRSGRFSSAQEFRTAILRAAERARRNLTTAAFANDLRNACGDDSASWLNLDVPQGATLDGGAPDGTGVIFNDVDDFDEDRPPTQNRLAALPSKELTSVVALIGDVELAETRLSDDPFAVPTISQATIALPDEALAPAAAAAATEFDDDEGIRTRVHESSSSRHEVHKRAIVEQPRATFEPPVPRPSPPPPGAPPATPTVATAHETRPVASPPPHHPPARTSNDEPTRISSSVPAINGQAKRRATLSRQELASGNLGGRPLARGLVMLVVILVLIALGIGFGVLLSGSDVELPNPEPAGALHPAR